MQANTIRPIHSRPNRKRVGRGNSSGQGTYAGKGLKGQKARSGGGVRPGFEGGQNPQIKGLPMLRGFKNRFRTEYQVVSLTRLSRLPEEVSAVTPQLLERHRLVRSAGNPIKVLGSGELVRPLQVQANRFSQSARAKIEAAGGTVDETAPKVEKQPPRKGKRARIAAAKAAAGAGPTAKVEAPVEESAAETPEEAEEGDKA